MRLDPTDILGKAFGFLTVTKYAGCKTRQSKGAVRTRNIYIHRYLCSCSCGGTTTVDRMNLLQDHTTSCGCLRTRRGRQSPYWSGHGEISGRFWTGIKRHASDRNLDFNLTIEEAWDQLVRQNMRCALTGWEISVKGHKVQGRYTTRTASLDRIDSTRGYSKDNIQWLHKQVNKSKMNFTQKDFIQMCCAVAGRFNDTV